jgi:hypothetical protein
MGFEYIDDLARRKKQEFPGCESAIDGHVVTIKRRLSAGEYGDAYAAVDDFLDLVRQDRTIQKPRRERAHKRGYGKRL